MQSSDSSHSHRGKQEKSQSPLCMPDLPLPTPPPMANIMVTSRFDLQTRGGCGYRRILSSRSTEFRSPLMGRSNISQNIDSYRSPLLPPRRFGGVLEQLALSPMPRHRNFEDLSKRLEDFDDFKTTNVAPHGHSKNKGSSKKSKYLSKDSVLSQELEEVKKLTHELESKYKEPSPLSTEVSPEYQTVFYNEHYMSDIDENEEIKQFICGYRTPERRYSDHSEKSFATNTQAYSNYHTLPSLSTFKCIKSAPVTQFGQSGKSFGSNSSMKSSDYYYSPTNVEEVQSGGYSPKILKSPQRPVVKIAKIR